MDHYIQFDLIPDSEFPETILMSTVFSKLHLALVEVGKGKIGVSFPKVEKTLGDSLRLHGPKENLEKIKTHRWKRGLNDYLKESEIRSIPQNSKYRIVKRIQSKTNIERLYRRSVKKGWLTQEEANEKMKIVKEKFLKLPFLQLKSFSSDKRFRLFVEHSEIKESPALEGEFSCYGLSNSRTIPWF